MLSLTSPRIVVSLLLLYEAGLLRNASILLAKEGVVPCLICVQTLQTLTSRVDERARRSVLRGDTQIADVAESILTLACGKECIEASVMRVRWLYWLWRCALRRLRRLEVGNGVGLSRLLCQWLVELACCSILG